MAGRFARRRDGTYAVRLVAEERDILRELPPGLADALAGDPDDPAVRRLFPMAFLDDDEAARAFGDLTHDDLARQRMDAGDTMAATIDAPTLSEAELSAWLAVINDTRLVLGSRLAITEESQAEDFTDEQQHAFLLYRFLTGLVTQIVKALSGISESSLFKDVMRREWEEQRGPD